MRGKRESKPHCTTVFGKPATAKEQCSNRENRKPLGEDNLMKCVISVLGKDTTGIVAEVAVALRECGANIDDISQTLLGDIFSMTMIVTLNLEIADFNAVQERLRAAGEAIGVQVTLQREDVFQMMYKI